MLVEAAARHVKVRLRALRHRLWLLTLTTVPEAAQVLRDMESLRAW